MEQVKPCVLVADDSRVVRKAANTILQGDYRVVEAGNGVEALSMLKDSPEICAVFLDLWMPGMDGFEVLEMLRSSKNPKLMELPVIVITGHSENASIRDRALSLGANDFVGKPFTGAQLLSSVKQALAEDESEDLLLPSFAANEDSIEPKKPASAGEQRETQEIKNLVALKPKPKRLNRREYLLECGNGLLAEARKNRIGLALLKVRIERAGALYHKCGESFSRDTLRALGKTISNETRRKDLLIRLNVTDFVVVMPATNALEARDVSKSIIRAVRRHVIAFEGARFHLTMSGGLVIPKLAGGVQFEALQALADVRLDKAVTGGGGQLVLGDMPLSDADDHRLSIDDALAGLKQGDSTIASGYLVAMLKKVLPFLVFANHRLKLNVDDALKSIHEKIKGI